MAEEKIFADGFLFKKKETAPDFVVGALSLKADEAVAKASAKAAAVKKVVEEKATRAVYEVERKKKAVD